MHIANAEEADDEAALAVTVISGWPTSELEGVPLNVKD